MPHAAPTADAPLKALLRHAKLRVTGVRLSILRALAASNVALDANAVADQLAAAGDHADRVTVYRTLNALARAGIAHRVHTGDRVWRYALAGASVGHDAHAAPEPQAHEATSKSPPRPHDAGSGTDNHPHFVCDACGRVECIDELSVVLKPARPGASAAKVRRDRRITRQDIVLHGTCARCLSPDR